MRPLEQLPPEMQEFAQEDSKHKMDEFTEEESSQFAFPALSPANEKGRRQPGVTRTTLKLRIGIWETPRRS